VRLCFGNDSTFDKKRDLRSIQIVFPLFGGSQIVGTDELQAARSFYQSAGASFSVPVTRKPHQAEASVHGLESFNQESPSRQLAVRKMDISDVGVRHAVAFPNQLLIKHSIELSPSTVDIAKEIRNTVIAVAVAWAVVSVVRNGKYQPSDLCVTLTCIQYFKPGLPNRRTVSSGYYCDHIRHDLSTTLCRYD